MTTTEHIVRRTKLTTAILWMTLAAAVGTGIPAYALSPDDLLFYAPLDGTATPLVTAGGDGVIEGTINYVPGLFGQAPLLSRHDVHLRYPVGGNINPRQGTIAFWVRSDTDYWITTGNAYRPLLTVPNKLDIAIAKNGWIVCTLFGEFAGAYPAGSTYVFDEWTQIVITWGNGKLRLYSDHENFSSNEYKPEVPLQFETGDMLEVARPREKTVTHDTIIDELMIFNRPLDAVEISVLRRRGLMQGKPSYMKDLPDEKPWITYTPPEIVIPQAASLPQALAADDSRWQSAATVTGFLDRILGLYCGRVVRADMLCDGARLHVRFDVPRTEQSESLRQKHYVELWLADDTQKDSQDMVVLRVSRTGDAKVIGQKGQISWTSEVADGDDQWQACVSVDLASIGMRDAATKGLRVNFVQGVQGRPEYMCAWSAVHRAGADLSRPDTMGRVTVTPDIPTTSLSGIGTLSEGALALQGRIGGCQDNAREITVGVRVQRTDLRQWYEYYPRSNGEVLDLTTTVPCRQDADGEFTIADTFFNRDFSGVFIDIADGQTSLYRQIVPFVLTPAVLTTVRPFPSYGYMEVEVDTSGYHVEDRDGLRAELTSTGPFGNDYEHTTVDMSDNLRVTTRMNLSCLPVGDNVVRTHLVDSTGQVVAGYEATFNKPKPFDWQYSQVGMDDIVLKPLTPLQVDEQRISMWGRTYVWQDSLLPAQIVNQGHDTLSQPVVISDRQIVPDTGNPATVRVLDHSDTRAHLRAVGTIAGIPVIAHTLIEYDGMIWIELEFIPDEPQTIDGMYLSVPVAKEFSTLYHINHGGWGSGVAGEVTKDFSMEFRPNMWLGNEELGLTWFAENMKGWYLKNTKQAIGVRIEDTCHRMLVCLADRAITIEPGRRICFGLNATPVKKLPDDWRFVRKDESYTWSGYQKYTDTESSPRFMHDSYPDKVARMKNEFNIKRFYQYQWLANANPDLPELPWFRYEWQSNPDLYGANSICTGSRSYCDLLIHDLMKYPIDTAGADGVYFDAGSLLQCYNESHGHGWRDENGVLHMSYTLRSQREWYRRMACALQKRRDRYILKMNAANANCVPAYNFATTTWNGEQFSMRLMNDPDYTGKLRLDEFRAVYMSQQWGFVVLWLLQFHRTGPNYDAIDTSLMFSLPHGVADLSVRSETGSIENAMYLHGVCDAQQEAGVRDMEFLPYWSNSDVVTLAPEKPNLVCSLWAGDGRVIVIIANLTREPVDTRVTLDLQKLGLTGPLTTWDAYERFRVNHPPFDYKAHWNYKTYRVTYPERPLTTQRLDGNVLHARCRNSNWRMIVVEKSSETPVAN